MANENNVAINGKGTSNEDMIDTFENAGYEVTELPDCPKLDALLSKTKPERAERLGKLRGEAFRVVSK